MKKQTWKLYCRLILENIRSPELQSCGIVCHMKFCLCKNCEEIQNQNWSNLWKLGGHMIKFGLVYGVWRHFQRYFSYIVVVSFIGRGKLSPRRKPPTCRKSLTNFMLYRVHLTMNRVRTHNFIGEIKLSYNHESQ